MRALFAAKGRPADHPVIMHLADASQIENYAAEIPAEARKLAAAFWPGPMTLVLRRKSRVSDLVTGGLDTVGLRVPVHPVAQALLREFAGPIAAPSANRFGRVSCTRAEHVLQELDGRVDLILDGGECDVGLESTIIDVSRGEPAILRPAPSPPKWSHASSAKPHPATPPPPHASPAVCPATTPPSPRRNRPRRSNSRPRRETSSHRSKSRNSHLITTRHHRHQRRNPSPAIARRPRKNRARSLCSPSPRG